MNHDRKIDNALVVDHLERAVAERKAKLRDGLANARLNGASSHNGNGLNGPSANGIDTPKRAAPAIAPEVQEQALVKMQAMVSQMERDAQGGGSLEESLEHADLRRSVHQSCINLRAGLARLSAAVTRLAKATAQPVIQDNGQTAAAPSEAANEQSARPREMEFEAIGRPLRITLESVPDFEGATAVQQALSDMPQASTAVVIEFEDSSASLDVELDTSVSLRGIMDQLREHTGRHYLVEQARPEEHKLRIRFIEHDEE